MGSGANRILIETAALESQLGDPALRILDCTVFLRAPAADAPRLSYVQESGRANFEIGHIPGAQFADLTRELSDRGSRLPFTMPPAEQFAGAMEALGVGEGTRVVCYDANLCMWATRVWWMLRSFGFDDAAVLDGGWKKWAAEGRQVSTQLARPAAARFVVRPRPELIANREDVLAAGADPSACVINALSATQHRGDGPSPYGRPGRIAGSVNVSARDLVDRETGAFLPLEGLRERFGAVGATAADRIITYCGGGIAATSDAFALTLLGHERVAVYDASLSEWARDDTLPMEVG